MKLFKKAFFSIIIVLSAEFAFSDDWYVCLGSFQNLENAKNFMTELKTKGFPAGITEHYVNNKLMYRVVYNEPFSTDTEARNKRNLLEKNPTVKKLKISNLWICKALDFIEESNVFELPVQEKEEKNKENPKVTEKLPEETLAFQEIPEVEIAIKEAPLPEVKTEKKTVPEKPVQETVLTVNTKKEIPLTEEKPYSVLINSYKEEQQAIHDKNRLEKKDIDSYILKTFDEDEFFSFDLHAGAFETVEETEELQQQLEDMGITNTQLSDYNDLTEAAEKYDETVEEKKVTYEDAAYSYPGTFAFYVKETLRQFPVNPDYQIEEVYIFDIDNLYSESENEEINSESESWTSTVQEFSNEESKIHALSAASYYDPLFDHKLTVLIAQGEENSFSQNLEDEENCFEYKFKLCDGILNSMIFNKADDYLLCGISDKGNMIIIMMAEDFTEEQFMEFLDNTTNDSGLLFYPQLRKTLAVLPKENETVERNFIFFKLSKVDYSYTVDRNYSAWSKAIVGHWEACGYFIQDETLLAISFFDMDYDYNAQEVHQMFMEQRTLINNYPLAALLNHSSQFDKAPAWYSGLNDDSNELSFSIKSYIVAIDSYNPEQLTENQLIKVADDLRIW